MGLDPMLLRLVLITITSLAFILLQVVWEKEAYAIFYDDQLAANSSAAQNFIEDLDLSLINQDHRQH